MFNLHWKPLNRRAQRFLYSLLLGLVLALGFAIAQTTAQTPASLPPSPHLPTLPFTPPPPHPLTLQAQQQFEQGDPQAALESWQQAETEYRRQGDETGAIGAQLNQAKALQSLGFYRRAKGLAEQSVAALQSQPNDRRDDRLKVNGLLTLGNLLRLSGDSDAAGPLLEQSLAIAQQLNSTSDIQSAHLHLGNVLLTQQKLPAALSQFQQAAAIPGPLQLTAQLRQAKLLQQLDRPQESRALLSQIATQLSALPPSQLTVYGRMELAALLQQADPKTQNRAAAQLLTIAAQQARSLGDRRAESYAIGRLGQLYEQTQQWAEAKQLTQEALRLARSIAVPEVLYQWQWQMGRILRSQGDLGGATASYSQAVDTLQSIRNDLVAIGQDVQFSFREQVEPIYRELVDLLLQPSPTPPENLQKARHTIESLQLAELNNFFREACLTAEARQIDQIDPTAAVFYPIVLPDRLDVILALPGQPLHHYTTHRPQAEIEAGIQKMRRSMRGTSFVNERMAAAQQLYQWLVQPAIADLEQHSIKTLVFVLDGGLRNVPMAALHDGTHYLIEQYQIGLAPGLQLLNPRPFRSEQIRALVAGLSESRSDSVPLPGVKQEVEQIQGKIAATVLLNQGFTTNAVRSQIKSTPFTVVHLATHGQFSSQAKDTYIQTWDGRLDVDELQTALNQRDVLDGSALELLVLSACHTAQGDRRAALGMAGIAVRSGARSTLATLWAVNDRSTAAFITEFYKALQQPGTGKAAAVRQAQVSLLRSQSFKHPFYWAPFILVGSWL